MSAVPKALDSGWLATDTFANQGSGTTVKSVGGNPAKPAPVVPTDTNPVSPDLPDIKDSDGLLYEPTGWGGASAWPSFSQCNGVQGVAQGPSGSKGAPVQHTTPGNGQQASGRLVLNEYAG